MYYLRDPESEEVKNLTSTTQFSGRNVLEIGCGSGWLTTRYAHLAKNTFGIDPSCPDLQKANRGETVSAGKAWFAAANGEHLPFPAGEFDIAVFSSSL